MVEGVVSMLLWPLCLEVVLWPGYKVHNLHSDWFLGWIQLVLSDIQRSYWQRYMGDVGTIRTTFTYYLLYYHVMQVQEVIYNLCTIIK